MIAPFVSPANSFWLPAAYAAFAAAVSFVPSLPPRVSVFAAVPVVALAVRVPRVPRPPVRVPPVRVVVPVVVAPVVVAANFSLGVNLVLGLVQQAARILGPARDAEVVETHHRAKRDAPSGTALMIARAIAAGHGVDYDTVKRHTRDGDIGPRPRGEIGVSTVRGGDVIGEHTATFFGPAERIEIGHRASSRSIFAAGALRAAAWVVGKPPGRYDMLDVLGLK